MNNLVLSLCVVCLTCRDVYRNMVRLTTCDSWPTEIRVSRVAWRTSSTSVRTTLHWRWKAAIHVSCLHCIKHCTASITFNTSHYSQPAYLISLPCFHISVCSLRSSNTNLLTVPFTCTGSHSFYVASPRIWNCLPPALHLTLSASSWGMYWCMENG